MLHPNLALKNDSQALPLIPVCDHYAGSEKLILKALQIQQAKGPVFDITFDCEDGAQSGQEVQHAKMIAQLLNSQENKFNRCGFRIHDPQSKFWKKDLEIVLKAAAQKLAYITIPKVENIQELKKVLTFIKTCLKKSKRKSVLPINVLIETTGALADIEKIAAIKEVQVLDFGIMDYIATQLGAIDLENAKSPKQFQHEVIKNVKVKIVQAALAHAKIPSHNVTLDLKNFEQTKADATTALNLYGFQRMWSVHPIQIDAILQAMQPDFSKVEAACAVLIKAQENNWGPIEYAGLLYDRANYRSLWQLVQKAKLSGIILDSTINLRWF